MNMSYSELHRMIGEVSTIYVLQLLKQKTSRFFKYCLCVAKVDKYSILIARRTDTLSNSCSQTYTYTYTQPYTHESETVKTIVNLRPRKANESVLDGSENLQSGVFKYYG